MLQRTGSSLRIDPTDRQIIAHLQRDGRASYRTIGDQVGLWAPAVTKHPEVVGAYTVTGDHDALLHVRVQDSAHLEDVLERIRSEEFVAQTRSVVVLTRLIERGTPVVAGGPAG